MTDMPLLPHVLALGAPQPGQSMLVSMFPLAAMLLIFYFLILMPMRKRQKKVDEEIAKQPKTDAQKALDEAVKGVVSDQAKAKGFEPTEKQ